MRVTDTEIQTKKKRCKLDDYDETQCISKHEDSGAAVGSCGPDLPRTENDIETVVLSRNSDLRHGSHDTENVCADSPTENRDEGMNDVIE